MPRGILDSADRQILSGLGDLAKRTGKNHEKLEAKAGKRL
jgi:hypothetical protein